MDGMRFSRIIGKCFFPDCPVNCCCFGEDEMKKPQVKNQEQINEQQICDAWRKVRIKLEREGLDLCLSS